MRQRLTGRPKRLFEVAFLLLCSITPVTAGIVAGNIDIDSYGTHTEGNAVGDLSGVEITAHYTLTDIDALTGCCEEGNLRWLQLVSSSTATGFTPTPNRPFIDPRSGQNIGGSSTGDALPWYDVTYPTSALTGINNGTGPYIYDKPSVLNERATPGVDYTFVAQTLLVCLYDGLADPKQLTILGGFRWGFTIHDGGPGGYSVTKIGATALGDTAAVRNAFNAALALDFTGYQIVPCADTNCQDVTLNVIIPELSTWVMVSGAGLILLIRRRFVRQ